MNGGEFKHDPKAEAWVDPYPKKKRKVGWLTGTVLFITIYVLSIGPVARLNFQGYISNSMLNALYFPIGFISDNSHSAENLFKSYVDLWLPKPTDTIP